MKTNEELKDQVICQLSVENQTLKNKVKKLEKDQSNLWRWYREKDDKLKAAIEELTELKDSIGTEILEGIIDENVKAE